MRQFKYIILFFMAVMLFSCSNDNEPSELPEGSPRDWTYKKDQIQFFINNIELTTISEITVRSNQLDAGPDEFPWYEQTLKIKGLLAGDKVFNIQVNADVERFEGSTTYNGIEYNVYGVYTGSPFEHFKDMGIILYLEDKSK